MGSAIAVLIPSLRLNRWDEIRANLAETAPNAKAYFFGKEFTSYADAINRGWKLASEPFLFLAADDVTFSTNWAEEALQEMKGDIRVVGSNDLRNPFVLGGFHATHSLVDRRYIEEVGGVIDQGPGSFLYPYAHQYTDSEFIETAQARSVFMPCLECVVEHLHPDFEGREADDVDRKTREHHWRDYWIFKGRRSLWEAEHPGLLEYPEPPCD